MNKKLYAMTDTRQNTITRVLQSHYRKYPCDIYREVINELVPLDRDAAVERMAEALYLERLGGYSGLTWETEPEDLREIYRRDARAALEALTNQEDE